MLIRGEGSEEPKAQPAVRSANAEGSEPIAAARNSLKELATKVHETSKGVANLNETNKNVDWSLKQLQAAADALMARNEDETRRIQALSPEAFQAEYEVKLKATEEPSFASKVHDFIFTPAQAATGERPDAELMAEYAAADKARNAEKSEAPSSDLPLAFATKPEIDIEAAKRAIADMPFPKLTPIPPASPYDKYLTPIPTEITDPMLPATPSLLERYAPLDPKKPPVETPHAAGGAITQGTAATAALAATDKLPLVEPIVTVNPELDNLIKQVSGEHTVLSLSKRYKEENKLLQNALIELGYLDATDAKGRSNADGYFGQGTDKAVKDFKANNGLVDDGKVGNIETWPTLLRKLTEKRDGIVYESSLGNLAPHPTMAALTPDRSNAIT